MTARGLIAVLTAGSAGLLTVAAWNLAPSAAAGAARREGDPHASASPSPTPRPAATAGGNGETVIIAPASPSPTPSPATTAGGNTDNVVIASASPSPTPSSSATAGGNGDTVVIAPEDDHDGNAQNDRRFRNRFGRPFGSNPHLEFTGWIGWPELTMGCHFDPDFEGADWNGRRVICVDRAVRPPGVGLTRVRGRRCLFPRRRCPFHRFP